MQKDIIKTILNKSKVSGDDVGRLLLADMAEEMESFFTTGVMKSVFTQAEFDQIRGKLTDHYQIDRYNLYVGVYNSLKGFHSIANLVRENVLKDINNFNAIIGNIQGSIANVLLDDKRPLVMTQTQFDRTFNEILEKENKINYSYIWIFLTATHYFINHYAFSRKLHPEKTPKDPEADLLIEKYKKEPVKSKELQQVFIDQFKAENFTVDYFFKDTGEPLPEDKIELMQELNKRGIPNKHEKMSYNNPSFTKIANILYPSEPTNEIIEKIVEDKDLKKYFTTKTTYEEPAGMISKYDISDLFFMFEDYDLLEGDDAEAEKEIIDRFNLILKELPELNDFITGKLEAYKSFKDYIPKKTADTIKKNIPYKVLYDNEICDFRDYATISFKAKYFKANNGVAIIKDDLMTEWEKEEFITPEGDYSDKRLSLSVTEILASSQREELEAKENTLTREEGLEYNFYNGVKFLNAYNSFVEIVANIVKVPKLIVLQEDMEGIKYHTNAFNNVLNILMSNQFDLYEQNGREQEAQKLKKTIQKTLPYINLEKVKVTEENYKKGIDSIKDLKIFDATTPDPTPIYIIGGIAIQEG